MVVVGFGDLFEMFCVWAGWGGGEKRMTRKTFFKYGDDIYRWKRILMLISDFKEFFQNFHFEYSIRLQQLIVNIVLWSKNGL
jgi:hypothetical protein